MATPSDDPEVIRAAQTRILAALNEQDDVVCAECGAVISHCFSIHGGWVWLAVFGGQENVPAVGCPKVEGPYGLAYGAHRPKTP